LKEYYEEKYGEYDRDGSGFLELEEAKKFGRDLLGRVS